MDVRWQRANKRHHDQHGWKDQDMSDTIESLKLRNEELEQHNSRLFEKERDPKGAQNQRRLAVFSGLRCPAHSVRNLVAAK